MTDRLKYISEYVGQNAATEREVWLAMPSHLSCPTAWYGTALSDLLSKGANADGEYYARRAIVDMANPKLSDKFPGQVALYRSAADRERDRRTAMKPGRAHRHMFPWLPETAHAAFATAVAEMLASESQLKVVASTEESAFVHAYATEPARYTNPRTESFRKSLANSCMRYEFANLPMHPAAAYASGDFQILYIETIEDDETRIAARCVLHIKSNTYAPIYGCTDAAMNAIERYLESIGASEAESIDWHGAKMQRIEHYDEFVMPYLDMEGLGADVYSSYLRLADENAAEFNCRQTNGTTERVERGEYCEDCEEHVDETFTVYRNGHLHGERQVCEYCRDDSYYFCEDVSEHVHQDNTMTRLYWRYGRAEEETVSDACDDYCITESGETWRCSDCEETYDGEYCSQEEINNGEYVQCCMSDKYMPKNDAIELNDGRFVHPDELSDEIRVVDGELVKFVQCSESSQWLHPDETVTLSCGAIVGLQRCLPVIFQPAVSA